MSQCRPSTKPNNVDRPIPFRKVLAQLLKRSGDSKRSSHYCHTTEKFSNKANPRPDSFQVKHSHIKLEAFAERQHVRLLDFICFVYISRSVKSIESHAESSSRILTYKSVHPEPFHKLRTNGFIHHTWRRPSPYGIGTA